ncbi:MAG TPA: tripartite tricarboxylate transporter permease [Thermodesulfobacteriota bacterium]
MEGLLLGFQVALSAGNLLYCLLGALLGVLVGILPGLGPAASIAILLPATFTLGPSSAIIMLAGIYYGAMYGGSTTSILVRLPGEAASVVTCLDGYEMARQGRAGVALGIAAIGSFVAGTLGVVALGLLAPPLAALVLLFGPIEYFALMLLGVCLVLGLAQGSRVKAAVMAALGFLLGLVGLDPVTGEQRFTFGIPALIDGIGFVPVAMGLFGIAEVLAHAAGAAGGPEVVASRIGRLLPDRQERARARGPILRGSLLGFLVGLLPGGGAVLSSFLSYALEKRLAPDSERFGRGAIEGVAGPEAANNAAASASFIPMLAMGIPSNAVVALMLAALMIHGVTPGPLLVSQHPDIFWGVIASMYVGNAILLVLSLPLITLFVQIARVPYRLLGPLVVLFSMAGAYSLNNDPSDVLIMVLAGVVGFVLRSFAFDPAPFVLTMVIAPMMEIALRQGLVVARGDLSQFFGRPLAALMWLASAAVLLGPAVGRIVRSARADRRASDGAR